MSQKTCLWLTQVNYLSLPQVNNLRLGKWITYGSTKELQFTRATNNKGYKGKSHALSVFPYFRVTSTQAGTVLTPFVNRVNSVHEPCELRSRTVLTLLMNHTNSVCCNPLYTHNVHKKKQKSRHSVNCNGTFLLPCGSLKRQRPTLPPWQYHRRGRA